ncbi:hypothetical protein CC86DRAFT_455162 [Ophiobolus disseminans]|uniref:Nucleoporin Pom152 n=1 Tax=Ophiobolus disseminans TaxID=1469910 RepID=A0A6A7A2H1_9PLEO|nr:hypothetical protein CC86DRAFT_455162 [Ophiobolus disseminans]
MNGTPARRGVGGFPTTPQTTQRSPGVRSPNGTTPRPNVRSPLQDLPQAPVQSNTGPLIPSDILDPAQQRFYVFALYVALWAYRSYDFYTLIVEEDQSLWLCLKWCFFDMLFMFGVPLLEIPWLEWSNSAAFLLFVVHAAIDVMLMFKIGVPVQAWFMGLVGFLWDSELAISERSVKPGAILHNASLILGKQIVNILPEGSAILNPDKQPFCLSSTISQLEIPILINQTEPIEMELLRIDVETNVNETIILRKKELGKMLDKAKKAVKKSSKPLNPDDPLTLRYAIKKPGVYLLKKVLDQSKLQVRPRASSLVIAICPQARVRPTTGSRCRNDLSNMALEVEGTPPLSIRYRLAVNGVPQSGAQFQNLQPDDHISPLSRHTSQALVKSGREDVSWAQSQIITVPLNESVHTSGLWQYEVEEVKDGLGNLVNFAALDEDERPKHKATGTRQSFEVHERPIIYLKGCSPQTPIKVAKNNVEQLPVVYSSTSKHPIDVPHVISYLFTPERDVVANGYHSPDAKLKTETMKTARAQPLISEPGLYTLKSVSTGFCEGEVLEPMSCLLQNPPEPGLNIATEDIVDKCAGNPIGLRVSLDLVGSPPFTVYYTEYINGRKNKGKKMQVATLRSTQDFTPPEAGHYTYSFNSISDSVYKDVPIKNVELQQHVRPTAQARFVESKRPKQACIDDTVEFDVRLSGDAPWKLEYEIQHNGKRSKHSVDTSEEHYTIKTDRLKSGGEYVVTLSSVSDKMGCKEFLQEEARVNVRHERPKAYFGHIEGKQTIKALEGRDIGLPLRFTGNGPWRLEYENLATKEVKKEYFQNENAYMDVKTDGTYHLLSVRDSVCPGLIEEKSSRFSVSWVARPTISVAESPAVVFEGGKYVKDPVCEGEEDSFDVSLSGNAPFDVIYQKEYKDKKGKTGHRSGDIDLHTASGTTSIRTDTSQAGSYEYTFLKLADAKYDHSKKHFTPITIRQTIHSRPSARFDKPGKTYSYCSREAEGEEVIPITLEGVPPFHLEVEIKHQGAPKPELSVHKNIPDNKYSLRIERNKLNLGQSSIFIRKVRDSRGCTLKPQPNSKDRVLVSVYDAPTATPLEDRTDFCVGERLSYALSGQQPFTVYYTFEGKQRKASNPGTNFRRLAELPGAFTITGLRDSASECLATLNLEKTIHPIPTVRLSGGQISEIDIHEGDNTKLEFDFWGTPPFEFTYTRSTNGKKGKVLEVKTERSDGHHLEIPVQEQGTYEVVSIKDRWCSFAKEGVEVKGKAQKMLMY